MKNALSNMLLYARLIGRKWVLWVFATLDLAGVVAQLLYPAFRLPQLVFVLITLVGLFWAGYQVYRDVAAQIPSRPIKPPPYELLPLSFEISLHQEIPRVDVWLYIVNYQPRELVLQSLEVTSLRLSRGPNLDSIPLSRETHLPPRRSEQILCHRSLIDAEVRAIERTQQRNPANATFLATARALAGRKHLHYETPSRSVNGWVS